MPDSKPSPYSKLRGESRAAWVAFCTYRDLGRSRTLTAAYEALHGEGKKINGQWSQWRKEFSWDVRVQQFDDDQVRLAQERAAHAEGEEAIEEIKAYRKAQAEVAKKGYELALETLAKIQQYSSEILNDPEKFKNMTPLQMAKTLKTILELTNLAADQWNQALGIDYLLEDADGSAKFGEA